MPTWLANMLACVLANMLPSVLANMLPSVLPNMLIHDMRRSRTNAIA